MSKSDLDRAKELFAQVDKLHAEIDTIVEPLARNFMQRILAITPVTPDARIALLELELELSRDWPGGFYRSELRTVIRQKLNELK